MKAIKIMFCQNISIITLLFLITITLTACTQTSPNINPNQAPISSESESESSTILDSDFYTIAYANMVNLDAAVKHKNSDVLYTVSNIQIMYGAYDKALETVNRGLEFSDDMMLVTNKADLLERFGDYDARDALVEQVIGAQREHYSGMNLDEKLYFNYLLISNDENEAAITNYLEILETGVEDSYLGGLYNNIGWAHLNIYDYENAKMYCEKSLEYEPGDSITLSNLGNCYFGLEDYETAIGYYDEAMLGDPYNSYAIFGYASAAQKLEDYDAAIEVWTQYVEMLPMDVDGWDGLYACYLATEDLEGQEKCLDALVSLVPAERSYAYDKLIVQSELGNIIDRYEMTADYREAAGDFEADRLFADFSYNYVSDVQGVGLYSEILSNDALTYSEYSVVAEDVHYLDEPELLASVLDKVEKNLSREERLQIEAYLYYYDEDPEKLMNAALEIVTINPESGYGYEYLGDAYYFVEDYEQAAASYGLAVMYSEDIYYSSQAQVDALILSGDVEQANQVNALFIESYPDDAYGYVYQDRIAMKMGTTEAAVDQLITAMTLSDYLENIFETYEELAPLKGRPELDEIGQ